MGTHVLAVANQKGGVAKTTTVASLGAAMTELGKRVLLVDLDAQGCGGSERRLDAGLEQVLGLAPGASVEDVRAAYRRLIRRVHPDLGGTSALAALLNAAKERLDPDVPRSN